MAEERRIRAVVIYSPSPRQVHEWQVVLAPGATVLQAVQASGLQAAFPELDLSDGRVGVWGRKTGLQRLVRDGDRVEIYRALTVDPKLARRERFRKQGSRAAGLFARKAGEMQYGEPDAEDAKVSQRTQKKPEKN